MDRKTLGLHLAIAQLGKPYIYDQQDPEIGFDCSGLCIFILRMTKVIPMSLDLKAQDLCERFSKGVNPNPQEGDLVFFGKDLKRITHVGICVGDGMMIEAGGGDRTTMTVADAKRRQAMVRYSPISSRKDYVCAVNPWC